MNLKLKYTFIFILIVLVIGIGLITINNKDENLDCKIAAIITKTEDEEAAVLLIVDYKWTKMPMRTSSDIFKIAWTKGYKVKNFSVKVNNKNLTSKFQKEFYNSQNEIVLKLNSNENFLSSENFRAKITLIPEDISEIKNTIYSSANIQYIHNGFLNNVQKSNSVSWKNKEILAKNQ